MPGAARSAREREVAASRAYDVLGYQDPHGLTAAETSAARRELHRAYYVHGHRDLHAFTAAATHAPRRELGHGPLPAQEQTWTARAMSRPQTRALASGIRHNLRVYKGILSKMMDDGYYASASASMNLQLTGL